MTLMFVNDSSLYCVYPGVHIGIDKNTLLVLSTGFGAGHESYTLYIYIYKTKDFAVFEFDS